MSKRALLILTSHAKLGNTGRQTGFYYDEMATPYWTLIDCGWEVTIASIAGGIGIPDPKTVVKANERPPMVARFMQDTHAMNHLNNSMKASSAVGADYQCIFLPGGHGAMWDFDSEIVGNIISDAWAGGAVIGAVCHGPAGLLCAKDNNGAPLVQNKRINSFTNQETLKIDLVGIEPFLLETRLRDLGGLFESSDNFTPHACQDGRLITGQNPQSTTAVCALLTQTLDENFDKHT